MAKMSRVDAQNKFLIYYGNRYAGVDGVSVWQLAGWELVEQNDSNELQFILQEYMTGNKVKLPFNVFKSDYTNIGIDNNPPKQMDSNVVSQEDDLAKRLNLMTDEEEAQFNNRFSNQTHDNTGGNPPPGVPNHPEVPESPRVSPTNPIHILLDGRKNKPTVKIPIEFEMEFIDDLFYKLIEQSYNDSLDSVIEYFISSVDMESVKQTFKDSIEIYIIEKLASDDSIVLSKKKDIDDRKNSNNVNDEVESDNKKSKKENNNTLTVVTKQKK